MAKLSLNKINEETLEGITLKGRLLTEKIFSIKDAGIDSKIFHVWKAKGLVDFIERGKWARLSFVDYLWLKTLETMRKFGCSVKLMKAIYDDLFTKAFKENLADKNLKSAHDYYKKLLKLRALTAEESKTLDLIEYNLKYPILNVSMRNEISYFYQLVLECLKNKTEAGIIIFEDGTFMKFLDAPHLDLKELILKKLSPHIYIPISSFILDFIAEEEKQQFLVKIGLLSEDEYRVIREIRNHNVKTIRILFDAEHNIEKIESDKKGIINGDKAKQIMEILAIKNYSSIELNTRDNKTLSFTYTEKKFF
ncbi:MAG: hypothetical protein JST86_16425 [Bacteroidetes bacterium]|nr:hypothetical protein [Bacteroidota bacterium]